MEQECDLVMKGGITSGVVYPHAIRKIASKYRLRSIGGTSAGAIAATFAAAAEFRRQENQGAMSGFDDIGALATELGGSLFKMFQPAPATRPLFKMLLAATDQQSGGGVGSVLRAVPKIFPGQLITGLVLIVLSIIVGLSFGSVAAGLLCVVLSVLAVVICIAIALKRMLLVELAAQDFGLCSGKTNSGSDHLAFGDWIASKIQQISGKTDGPLTIRDLRKHGIDIATMTSDLSTKRPYRLPLETNIHFFSKAEFEKLFPADIIDYLCSVGEKRTAYDSDTDNIPKDLYKLPVGDDFPVYLVARLSLSFPGLISAVPLWRIDYKVNANALRRCLFSDGGISSNFPIHFFDSFLPSRPTFGIALGSYQENVDCSDEQAKNADRIEFPTRTPQSTAMPVSEVLSLPGFLMAILNTAKDWQDNMQSLLPGYAERIVTIKLIDRCEGGLNLNMPKETITRLGEFGEQAGDKILDNFNMDDQRLRRARSFLPAIEGALDQLSDAYDDHYADVLTSHNVNGHKKWREDPFAVLAKGLSDLGKRARSLHDDPNSKSVRQGDVPHFDAEVRLIATADRVPKDV